MALAVIAVCAASAHAAPPSVANAAWQFRNDLDADACWDVAYLDRNANGYAENWWYDVDNDCRLDTHLWNSVGADNFLESLTFDMNEDGHWEIWLVDTNQVVGFDVAYLDDNRDGFYDRWNYVPTQATPTLGTIGGAPNLSTTGTIGGGNRSGTAAFLVWLAGRTGKAVWAGPHSDSDGWPDSLDHYPTDPFRH